MKHIITYYLKPYYLRMTMGFFIKFTGTVMDLFLPWTLAYMIDTVIPENRREEIALWGLFMLFCSALAVTFNIIANRMASRVASNTMNAIRGDLFKKVMYLSAAQCDGITKPSLISRLTSDTYHVHQMLGRIQRLGVRAPILLVGGIFMTLLLDPVLACVLLGTLPLLAGVVVLVSQKSIPLFSELQESVDQFVRLVREDIAGIRVIKALSKEEAEKKRFDDSNTLVVNRERRATVTAAITNPVMNLLLNLGLVGVILAGACRVNRGLSEVGKILAFMTYFTIILNALMSISRMFIMVSKAASSASRIMEVLNQEEEAIKQPPGAPKDNESSEEAFLEFDHVSFSYTHKIFDNPNEDGKNQTGGAPAYSLEDIHFTLKKGQTLGIIGSTGSGKSTIANLMMRFYEADKGSIWLNGQDIRSMELRDLRKQFGAVFQNDVIFEDTILENIRMGRDLTEEQVREGLAYAKALDFVEEKGGIHEKLEIRGANLSGGQKQRLFIARALAANPAVLILDDSSSALDYKTDASLRKELKHHFPDTTCIIIAQRISSVMNADHIMVLEEGRVIGYGNHESLMTTCEVYREIGKSQMGQ